MSNYIYKGRSKVIQIPKQTNVAQIEKATFILIGSSFISSMKTCGTPYLFNIKGSSVLDYHLDCIQLICKKPDIIVIAGFEFEKIAKHNRRCEFKIIENVLYEFSNTALDIRYGLNIVQYDNIFLINCTFIPTVNLYKKMLENELQSKIVTEVRETSDIGVILSNEQLIMNFTYLAKHKLCGMTYLTKQDTNRMQKKIIGSTFLKTKFDFEVLDEVSLLSVDNTYSTISIKSRKDIDK